MLVMVAMEASCGVARIAVLALAGELATAYEITGWAYAEAIRAPEVGFAV